MTKHAEKLSNAFGYLSLKEVRAIYTLAKGIKTLNPTFVNIGAGSGTSGLAMAEIRPDADIFTIDISDGGPLGGLENERNAFLNTGLTVPHQILGTSHEIATKWSTLIDFIFVDDGHTEPDVRGDIESWLPYIRDGGVMAFHDYRSGIHQNWPAVKRVVDELMSGYEVVLHEDAIIAYRIARVEEVGDDYFL